MELSKIEPRTDCDSFEAKRFYGDCGDCQTDGHYLCKGCRYIAPYDAMEVFDNIRTYYHAELKQKILAGIIDGENGVSEYCNEDVEPLLKNGIIMRSLDNYFITSKGRLILLEAGKTE